MNIVKKNREGIYDDILDSVNEGQNLLNTTNSTEQLIAKYNISSDMDLKTLLRILKIEAVNNILSMLINSGKIEEQNRNYYYDDKKFTETDIKKTIFKTYKEGEIKNMMISECNKVKIIIQKEFNTKKIEENNQAKIVNANNIMKLQNDLKEQIEVQEKLSKQYLDALYKLNEIEAKQRKERAQIEFNKNQEFFQQDMLRANDNELIQFYKAQQIKINNQRLEIDKAKKDDDHYIDKLEIQYLENLNKQRQHDESEKQKIEHHNQLIRLQQDIANKADENFKNLINGAKENNDALIEANNINNQAIINANAKQGEAIIQNQNQGNKSIVKGLQELGGVIDDFKGNFIGIRNAINVLNNNMEELGKKINNPLPAFNANQQPAFNANPNINPGGRGLLQFLDHNNPVNNNLGYNPFDVNNPGANGFGPPHQQLLNQGNVVNPINPVNQGNPINPGNVVNQGNVGNPINPGQMINVQHLQHMQLGTAQMAQMAENKIANNLNPRK
jgi:hypothetical protein